MKRRIVFVFVFLLAFFLVFPNKAKADEKNIYAPFETFEELYEAYGKAIKERNIEQQKKLLEIGRRSLIAEMEMADRSIKPTADPDKIYWINQFPNYFSYGYFEIRSNGLTLSLGNKLHYWSAQNKANGWNSVYAKFSDDNRWAHTNVMREQFYCHARLGYAAFEKEWNLEPWRTSINPITCNE